MWIPAFDYSRVEGNLHQIPGHCDMSPALVRGQQATEAVLKVPLQQKYFAVLLTLRPVYRDEVPYATLD